MPCIVDSVKKILPVDNNHSTRTRKKLHSHKKYINHNLLDFLSVLDMCIFFLFLEVICIGINCHDPLAFALPT